jgi:hypothetical protein
MRLWTLLVAPVVVLAACNDGENDDDGTQPSTLDMEESGAQVCGRAPDRAELGAYEPREDTTPPMNDFWIWGGGVTAADLNDDGWLELLVALEQGLELYEGSPSGDFEQIGIPTFGAMALTYGSGTSVADYDGDGDLDIYVLRVMPETWSFPDPPADPGLGENRLLRNDGNLTFVDVTAQAGVQACGETCYRSMAGSWGDLDLDGDLDLYVGNYGYVDEADGANSAAQTYGEPDFLYRNDGDGTFTDISSVLPQEFQDGYTYVGGMYDFDADGDLDLYTINDFGTDDRVNRVLWNDGTGNLIFDPFDPSGLAKQMTGMGLGIGDLNGDGWLDLAISEWKDNWLLMSAPEIGDGVWIDEADSRGFTADVAGDQWVGWGTELGDVDNDGDQDIVQQFGFVANDNELQWFNPLVQPDALYLATPDGSGSFTFDDQGVAWGVDDAGMSRGVSLADLDRDGWLDMAKRDLAGNSLLYVSRCGDEGWLTVHLRDPDSMNTYGVGAVVTATVGDLVQTRTVLAGGTGFASSPPPELHFGLGMADQVDKLDIRWMDGREDTLTNITARQQVTLTR